jgi:predicted phage tail protein
MARKTKTLIPFAGEIEDERGVGVTVRNDGPVTRTITDSQTDAVRITISVPRLEQITNTGDTVGESFRLQIQIQYNGGGFVPLSLMTPYQAALATHIKRHTS